MARLLLSILPLLCISCFEKTEKVITKAQSLDLISLQEAGLLDNTKVVTVIDDPVYHKSKRYNAVPLLPLLREYTFLDSLDASEMKVVFECEDGYKPEMPLGKLLKSDVYVAISDLDAPTGRKWEQVFKDGIEMKAAPFYIVYKSSTPTDNTYKKPYNLVKIHFEPLTVAEVPPTENHQQGRELYKQHCKVCHALNGAGGNMGPELNRPISITAYWKKEHLVAFIQNPQAYREEVKMPNLGIAEEESIEIVAYLTEISSTN